MKVTIDGQDYPFPLDMTIRETQLVKRGIGLLAGEMWSAALLGDNDGTAAYCLVALYRAERDITPEHELVERILNMPARLLAVDFSDDEKEAGAGPPAEAGAEGGRRARRSRSTS